MSKGSLNLRFVGKGHEVEVHYEGRLVLHTTEAPDGKRSHLISLAGGPHALATLFELDLACVQGPCAVKVRGAASKTLRTRARLRVPPGSELTLSAKDGAVVRATPRPGPGFGSGRGDRCELD